MLGVLRTSTLLNAAPLGLKSSDNTHMSLSSNMLDVISQFARMNEHLPNMLWDVLESLLKALGLVLLFHVGQPFDLADVDSLDPAVKFVV